MKSQKELFFGLLAELQMLDVSVSERLKPTNYAAAKEQFLEGARCLGRMTHGANDSMAPTRPSFKYGDLDRAQIKQNLERCRRLSHDVVHLEYGADERDLLVWLLDNIYHKWRLLEAASDLDCFEELDNTISRQSVENRFRRYNAKVYGEPDEQTFLRLLNYQLTSLPEAQERNDWEVRINYLGAEPSAPNSVRALPQAPRSTLGSLGEVLVFVLFKQFKLSTVQAMVFLTLATDVIFDLMLITILTYSTHEIASAPDIAAPELAFDIRT